MKSAEEPADIIKARLASLVNRDNQNPQDILKELSDPAIVREVF